MLSIYRRIAVGRVIQNQRKFSAKVGPTMKKNVSSLNLKQRANPIVCKLESTEFKSIFNESLYDLIAIFKKNNYELRIAGGAVRDLLMHKTPTDIDFATVATPVEMRAMFEAEEVRMVNVNGEKHGTITPRIKENQFEVTTLRVDDKTDGRHAEVIFTTDWMIDASRRDLTINSMFLDLDGNVYDYFYGYEDMLQRRVKFVGDPEQRILEDYLRILRYFRFYGRVADEIDKHEDQTLTAITKNIDGLKQISGERIWGELKKILSGKYAAHLVIALLKCGAATYIGLPDYSNTAHFEHICKLGEDRFKDSPLLPITKLSALINTPEEALQAHKRLKFSAYERDMMKFIVSNKETTQSIDELLFYQRECFKSFSRAELQKEFVLELLKFHGKYDLVKELSQWSIPRFPITGEMLITNGCPRGTKTGMVMQELKARWYESSFKLNCNELLEFLPEAMEKPGVATAPKTNNLKRKSNERPENT